MGKKLRESSLAVQESELNYENNDYDYGGYDGEGYDASGLDSSKGYCDDVWSQTVDSMITLLDNGLYVCTECGKENRNKKDLKRHVSRKHVQGPSVSCQFCEKEFKNQPTLQV